MEIIWSLQYRHGHGESKMKYFFMGTDLKYCNSPIITGWYDKMDVRDVHSERAYRLPRRELLFIKEYENTVFTDIISSPLYLVSELVKDVILLYEPATIMKEIVLLDRRREKVKRYFLPIFREIVCLSDQSETSRDGRHPIRCVIKEGRVSGCSIFRISGLHQQYVAADLEIVESILKRGARGIGLQEIDVE